MEKEFVPYKQAVVLKELGFDEPCFGFYNVRSLFVPDYKVTKFQIDNLRLEKCCLAPTFAQAFRWFREKGIYENIIYDWNDEVYRVTIMIQKKDRTCVIIYLKEGDYIKDYNTYEEAELECIKKLIELYKKN